MRTLVLLGILGLSAGCAVERDGPDQGPLGDLTSNSGLLPAGMTADERRGKEDGWDPRDQYPEAYGYTAPPGGELRMPGEFEEAERLIVAWGEGAWELERYLLTIIREGAAEMAVTILVPSQRTANYVAADLEAVGGDPNAVEFLTVQIDSVWVRDFGPMAVKVDGEEQAFVDARYYWGRWNDDYLPTGLASYWGVVASRPPIDMEGGNLLSDGTGRCVTTEVLVSNNAHRGYGSADVRSLLREYYGCDETIIVPSMIGEDTGHVDMHVHITGPGQVLVGAYDEDEDSLNAGRLDQTAELLEGAGFLVRRIPMPWNGGRRVFRTYTNGIAFNDTVLVPVYAEDDRYEDEALAAIGEAYPGRRIVALASDEIIQWSGAVHCVTMTLAE